MESLIGYFGIVLVGGAIFAGCVAAGLTLSVRVVTGQRVAYPVAADVVMHTAIWVGLAVHLLAESVANRSLYRHHNDLIDLEEWAWRQIRKRIDPACTRLYGWPTSELAIVES